MVTLRRSSQNISQASSTNSTPSTTMKRAALIAPDQTTFDYVRAHTPSLDQAAWQNALDDWRNLPPKVDARWDEVVKYKKGDNTPIEHIKEGHWPDANTPGKSHFHEGITEQQLKDYVDEALRKGDIDPTDPGKITYDLDKPIGTDPQGNPVTTITVYVRDGVVNTAFPSP